MHQFSFLPNATLCIIKFRHLPSSNHSMTSGSVALQPRVAGGIINHIILTSYVFFYKKEKKYVHHYTKKIISIVSTKSH